MNDDVDANTVLDAGTTEPTGKFKRDITGRMLYFFILCDALGAGIYALTGQVGEVT